MIKVSPDTPKIIALEGMVDELTTALAAKTEDFGRLCKDFDAHDAELKRIIAGLRAELEAKVEQLKMVPMKYRRMEFNAQLQRENMELRVERDALAAQLNRVRRALDAEP